MAKRDTGVGKGNKTRNHKTKKRLEIKRQMLEAKKKTHKYMYNLQKKFNS